MINEIDPRIYNFKNLKLEDQVVVASQFKIFLLVKKEKEDLKETADKQNSLTKFLYEVAIEELDEVEEKIMTAAEFAGFYTGVLPFSALLLPLISSTYWFSL